LHPQIIDSKNAALFEEPVQKVSYNFTWEKALQLQDKVFMQVLCNLVQE